MLKRSIRNSWTATGLRVLLVAALWYAPCLMAASEIKVDSVNPAEGEPGTASLDVTIHGSGFAKGAKVKFLRADSDLAGEIDVNSVRYVDPTILISTISIAADAVPESLFDIEVTVSGRTGKGIHMFKVRQREPKTVEVWTVTLGEELSSDDNIFGMPGGYQTDANGFVEVTASYQPNPLGNASTPYSSFGLRVSNDKTDDTLAANWIGFRGINISGWDTLYPEGSCRFYPGAGEGGFPSCMGSFLSGNSSRQHPANGYSDAVVRVAVANFNFEEMGLGEGETLTWEPLYNYDGVRLEVMVHPGTDCRFPFSGVGNSLFIKDSGSLSITRESQDVWLVSVDTELAFGEFGWAEVQVKKRTSCQYYSFYDYSGATNSSPIRFTMTFRRTEIPQ